jgi:hypothetical protein
MMMQSALECPLLGNGVRHRSLPFFAFISADGDGATNDEAFSIKT